MSERRADEPEHTAGRQRGVSVSEAKGPGARPPNAKFGKALRVRKRAEFQLIQSRGRRVATRHFVLLLSARLDAPTGAGSAARLGITASKRIGNAVVRNRVKRIVREAFRQAQGFFAPDIDVVVLVRENPAALSPAQVLAEWTEAKARIERSSSQARTDKTRPEPPGHAAGSGRGRGRRSSASSPRRPKA